MNQEYQKWLDGLKVGDEVYCTWGERIEKVTHITKGGQIDVGKIRYKEGKYRGKNRWDTTYYIKPITPSMLGKIELKHLSHEVYNKLSGNNIFMLPLEKLKKINAILEETDVTK